MRALSDAHLRVDQREIVALMGANGAGKSTFIKILTGVIRPDQGQVLIWGKPAQVGSPAEARKSGLVPVYQEPSLIPDLDINDNLRLGDTPIEPFREWVNELGVSKLNLFDMIGDLPLATLRILDLARALATEPDVLLLDEMTAALPTDLVENVIKVVRQKADEGLGVIYVSHRFSEISELCDRASILRDGQTVGDLLIEAGVEERAVELMLGQKIDLGKNKINKINHTRSEIPKLSVRGLAIAPKVKCINFDLFPKEVLGIVALEGQGQDELFDCISGFCSPTSGTIEVDGQVVKFKHPADAISVGLTLVPGNRADALLSQRSVSENIALPFSAHIRSWGNRKWALEREKVENTINKLQIDTRAKGEVQWLSGGNQQKVTLGRWIATGVNTLLLFDPTRGIDVRTKRQIYPLVREIASQGASVLYYTSELEEVSLACDRVVIIFNGKVVTILDSEEASEQNLLFAAYGFAERKETV